MHAHFTHGERDPEKREHESSISLSEWKEKNKAEYEQTVGEIQKNYPIVPKDEEEAPKE